MKRTMVVLLFGLAGAVLFSGCATGLATPITVSGPFARTPEIISVHPTIAATAITGRTVAIYGPDEVRGMIADSVRLAGGRVGAGYAETEIRVNWKWYDRNYNDIYNYNLNYKMVWVEVAVIRTSPRELLYRGESVVTCGNDSSDLALALRQATREALLKLR